MKIPNPDPWITILAGSKPDGTAITVRDYSSLHGARDQPRIAGPIRLRFTERYLDPALDSKKETCLQLTVAVLDQAGKPVVVKTLKEWVPLEMSGRYQLGVSLRGNGLQRKPEGNPETPPSYTFRGRFDGETEERSQTITLSGAKPAVSIVPILKDSTVK